MLLGATTAVLLFSSQAAAQNSGCDSEEHLRGRQLREQHRDEDALLVFQGIYQREHTACARARMGLALRALGRWVQALEALEWALAQTQDPWVAGAQELIQRELAEIRPHVGELEIALDVPVPGAEVWIDGLRVATLPMQQPLHVAAGTVVVEFRAAGYRTIQRTVVVQGTLRTLERVSMVPVVADPTVAATESQIPGEPSASGRRMLAPPLIAFGGALAFGIGGGIAWGFSVARYGEYLGCGNGAEVPELVCPDLRRSASTLRHAGIGSFVASGISAVTGVVLLLAGPREPQRTVRAGIRCLPSMLNPGVECLGAF